MNIANLIRYTGFKQNKQKTFPRCGFLHLRRCCNTNYYQARAYYKTYWCAALGPVHPHSGYRFGGVYTSTSVNLVTGNKVNRKMLQMLSTLFHRIKKLLDQNGFDQISLLIQNSSLLVTLFL